MNFFEHQAKARAQSRWLLLAFAGAVLAVALAVVGVLALTLAAGQAQAITYEDARLPHQGLLLTTGLGVLAVMLLASLYKTAQIKGGGAAVAASLGGVAVPPAPQDARLRRLRNVVEEIAIAAGLPVPQIFVLEREEGINAFAAGFTPADAAVAVTRGALEKLTRDELQGVIAHEFSHILNGDMRLNIRLMGWLFGLLVIHTIGREIIRRTPSGGKRGGTLLVLGFGLMAAGGLGMVFARLIKAGLSRQREYLADASAVQFTRQRSGISGALQKIAGMDAGSRLHAPDGEGISHMLFGDGQGYSRLFATHPPLLDRIRRIDPQFRPATLHAAAERWNAPGYCVPETDDAPVQAVAPAAPGVLRPAQVVAQVAHPGADDYRHAEQLHATLPAALLAAASDDRRASALLLALLHDGDSARAAAQQRQSAQALGAAVTAEITALRPLIATLHPAQRLPLAALAFPALRRWPLPELQRFAALLDALSRCDGRISAFEFALGRLLRVQLADWMAPADSRDPGRATLAACTNEAAALLSALAEAGHADPQTARRAFAAGWTHLFPRDARTAAATGPAVLDAALDRLDTLRPPAKQLLIEAMVVTLGHDGRVSVGEAELLRVVCASLRCPLPVALHGARA